MGLFLFAGYSSRRSTLRRPPPRTRVLTGCSSCSRPVRALSSCSTVCRLGVIAAAVSLVASTCSPLSAPNLRGDGLVCSPRSRCRPHPRYRARAALRGRPASGVHLACADRSLAIAAAGGDSSAAGGTVWSALTASLGRAPRILRPPSPQMPPPHPLILASEPAFAGCWLLLADTLSATGGSRRAIMPRSSPSISRRLRPLPAAEGWVSAIAPACSRSPS